jgi:hypothetical protein
MKRFALLFALLVFSGVVIGCEGAPPPAGTPAVGPPTGAPIAGEAKRDRDRQFKDLEEKSVKAAQKK